MLMTEHYDTTSPALNVSVGECVYVCVCVLGGTSLVCTQPSSLVCKQ